MNLNYFSVPGDSSPHVLSDVDIANGGLSLLPPGYVALTGPPPISLAQAQTQQIGLLSSAYVAAIAGDLNFTNHSGIVKTYQADPQSISNLSAMILAFAGPAATPAGFYWIAVDNTQIPFTFADLQGLATAFGVQGAAAFQRFQTQKAAVLAASTVAAVQAITF